MRSRVALIAIGLLAAISSLALACLWDYDTLAQERARFPGTLELITGRFPRHSRAFYEWRMRDRLARLEKPENAALYDDLAVAYDKLGVHESAIATMEKKESLHPGMYETQANLATFYFHSGQLEKAIEHVEQALKIDPNAHFGREKYQLLLGKFVLHGRAELRKGLEEPKPDSKDASMMEAAHMHHFGFAQYLESQGETDKTAAIKGVLGMMRFANYDSPILLEALASLLSSTHEPDWDARQLATRALLQASYKTQGDEARSAAFREAAKLAILWQTPASSVVDKQYPLETLEAEFRRELAEAETWIKTVEDDEQKWIAAHVDVDAEFQRKYYQPYEASVALAEQSPQLMNLPGIR